MIACSPPRNDLIPSQNVEVTWLRPAALRKPQNNTKFDEVWNVLNQLYLENMGQLLNLEHLETAKSKFKKIGWTRPEKSKLEKGWFGSKESSTTL